MTWEASEAYKLAINTHLEALRKKSLKLHLLNKIKKISQQFEVENFNYQFKQGF